MTLPTTPPPVVTGNPRYDRLLELVGTHGHMRVERLAELLDVSAQTIRRDIRKLSEEGILSRFHGGAGQASSAINRALEKRETSQIVEKKRIAEAVASRIPDRSTVFLSAGSTVEYVARALETRENLRIITSSLRVAHLIYQRTDFEVLIPGGSIRSMNGGIVGPNALEFLRGFRADILVTSIGAIDHDGTLLDFDVNEVAIMQVMMANAKQFFLAADHTKFQASASVQLGKMTDIDVFFTDSPPPQNLSLLLSQQQIEVIT